MKKHLLMLLSWTMLLLGAFSFASCGDDDDEDDNDNDGGKKTEANTSEPFVHKYRSQTGVYIDGDDIIDVMPTMILTYHFSNDTKMDEVKEYVYQFSHAIAEQAFEQMKDAGFKDLKVEGSYISYKIADDDVLYNYDGETKQELYDHLVETHKDFQEIW
ncbi:MAG: hypothetical protein U0K71_13785 [Paludibacteraceae bacterium]|nr:hypothetical protein [Paludibacteraceae bacterium]